MDGLWLDERHDLHTGPGRPGLPGSQLRAHAGALTKPVLTLHTTIDGLVLAEHESAYAETVNAAGASDWLVQTYTDTYPPGHVVGSLHLHS